MIYDEISKELIEFISNPIQNMQYLEKKESKFKMMFNLSSKAIIGEYINNSTFAPKTKQFSSHIS